MKEFIEKLIGRLEEYKYSHLVEHDKERLEHCTENERAEHCEGIDCFWCVWNKSIEIVNQLAEEYLPEINVGNNGWIPVSERLPEVNQEVLVFDAISGNSIECLAEDEAFIGTVLAWMPIAPYQPKGE